MNSIGVIHELRSPSFIERIPSKYRGLTCISVSGKRAFEEKVFNIPSGEHSKEHNISSEADDEIEHVANFIHTIRHLLYSIFSYLTSFRSNFYQVQGINELVVCKVFRTANWLEPAYWKLFFESVFKPYVLKCTEELYGKVVHGIYSETLMHYHDKVICGLTELESSPGPKTNSETHVSFKEISPLA